MSLFDKINTNPDGNRRSNGTIRPYEVLTTEEFKDYFNKALAQSKDSSELKQKLLAEDVSESAVDAIAKAVDLHSKDADAQFAAAIQDLANGRDSTSINVARWELGRVTNKGALQAPNSVRSKEQTRIQRRHGRNQDNRKSTEDGTKTQYEYTQKAISNYVDNMRVKPGTDIHQLYRFRDEAEAAGKKYEEEIAVNNNNPSARMESFRKWEAEMDKISDKYGLSSTNDFSSTR